MKVINKAIGKIYPYKNNPRHNANAIEYVASSIRRFGFNNPILIDKDGVIISGHTRYEAAKILGLKKIPCVMAEDMTEEQIKAFRLVDNKVGEQSTWDWEKLQTELQAITGLDMEKEFGFEKIDLTPPEPKTKPEKNEHECKCPKCGKKFEV